MCGTARQSLALEEFRLHILPFIIFSKIFFSNSQGLTQPKPCTVVLADFPVRHRRWAGSTEEGSQGERLLFQSILHLSPRTQGALCSLLSLPGTVLCDEENCNAHSKRRKTITVDANVLVLGVWQLERVKGRLMC